MNIRRYKSMPKRIKITIAPKIPSSSQIAARIISFCTSGIAESFWTLFPSPLPQNPPEPIAYNPCITWYPPSAICLSGWSHVTTRWIRKLSLEESCTKIITRKIPTATIPPTAILIKGFVFGCATKIIPHTIPATIIAVLKLSVKKNTLNEANPP